MLLAVISAIYASPPVCAVESTRRALSSCDAMLASMRCPCVLMTMPPMIEGSTFSRRTTPLPRSAASFVRD